MAKEKPDKEKVEKETSRQRKKDSQETNKKPQVKTEKKYDLSLDEGIFELFKDRIKDDEIRLIAKDYFLSLAKQYDVEEYYTIILYDELRSIDNYEANKLYKSLTNNNNEKDILLILSSLGGKVESAYLISKSCKKLSKNKFLVAIPRKAKSAATLLAFGADEIHMGIMSELGPIDPQIGGYPALGLGNSLNVLADLSCNFPGSSKMFAEYLSKKLELNDLGYFERVSVSATQYAERLLHDKKLPNNLTANELAKTFVYDYKDHGFVIDIDEAASLLGENIKHSTKVYDFANAIYTCLSSLDLFFDIFRKKHVTFVGDLSEMISIRKNKE